MKQNTQKGNLYNGGQLCDKVSDNCLEDNAVLARTLRHKHRNNGMHHKGRRKVGEKCKVRLVKKLNRVFWPFPNPMEV